MTIILLAPATAFGGTNGAAAIRETKQANVLPPPDQISPTIFLPASQTVPPPTFRINARQAIAIADRVPQVVKARKHHPTLKPTAFLSPLQLAAGQFYHWDVIYVAGGERRVEVEIGPDGVLYETQTYPDVGWPLLRGYPKVLGQKLNAPYVWLPLCLLFLLPFFDPRRLTRLLHLDLFMVLAFGLSHYWFARGRPDISVPLVYPFLIYFAVRLAWAGFRPKRRSGALVPYMSTGFLAFLLLTLVVLRVGFGAFGSNTFDVSAAGVVGADRIEHGLQLYVFNDTYGDTYGPLNYLAYVPGELIFPVQRGIIDAARFTTVGLDLLVILGLFLLGRSFRPGRDGMRLGVIFAFAWAACPYTALLLGSNTNDALVPLFVIYALVALRSPPGRGILTGLAAMAKFAPLIVAPVLIVGRGPFRWRSVLVAGACFAAVCVGLVFLFLPDGGLKEFWNTTLGFQIHRETPLSIWVRAPYLDFLRPVTDVLAVGLAITATFLPRRRSVGQVAALIGAIFAAAQIPANYWIYFYIAWFAPFAFVGLFDEYRSLGPKRQASEMSDLGKPLMISQPDSVTATRSSMRTPSTSGT